MKSLDRIPDWLILVLAVLLVAGVFKLFGGIGILVLAIISTVIWIAQIIGRSIPVAQRISSRASEAQSDASSLSRPRRRPRSIPATDADKAESMDHQSRVARNAGRGGLTQR